MRQVIFNRRWVAAVAGVLAAWVLGAAAQVVPPPGHPQQWAQGYQTGFGDGAAAATQPAPQWPADVTYTPDHTYHIAPNGSDKLSDGSLNRPFATLDGALKQIAQDRRFPGGPKLAEISYRADGTYPQACNMNQDNLLIDSYGGTTPGQRATILSTGYAFLRLQTKHVHYQNLIILGDPKAGGETGIYSNGGDDLTIDHCDIENFTFNICLVGGVTHVRIRHCFIANAYTPTMATMACSGLYTECVAPDVQCNVFYHNGWRAPFDLNNAKLVQAMMFRHGWYENPSAGATAGTDCFNYYLRNACTGHQCRAGGSLVQWNVFWDNGNASDVFTGAGLNHNLGGEIAHCAFFGNLTRDFACWGGGAQGESLSDNFHDLLFASNANSMQLPPAITLNLETDVPVDRTSFSITDCRGIWCTGDVANPRNRAVTIKNVNIRKPIANEHVPTLLDFFGTNDEPSTISFLQAHMNDPKYSTTAVIDWLGRSMGQ